MSEYQRKLNVLRGYNDLCKYIDDLACDYGELFTKATKINQVLHDDTGPSNHDNSSKVESMSALLVQKKERLERAIAKRQKIDKALKKLGVRNEYIVRQTCIGSYSLYRVSRELKMNYKYAISLRRRLLEELEV